MIERGKNLLGRTIISAVLTEVFRLKRSFKILREKLNETNE